MMEIETAERSEAELRDYSLLGAESKLAVEKGLAEATWYMTPIPKEKMRDLLIRRDGPAISDTIIWLASIIVSGYLFYISWGHWWAVFPYIVYTIMYATPSDSRWHEAGHGTAFKTDWMNKALYEIASFMIIRQSLLWRWSHIRHHSDTIIRGRDPEIQVPRPPDIKGILLQIIGLNAAPKEFKKIIRHAAGKIDPEVATFVPKSDYPRIFLRARIYVFIYATVIGLSIYFHTLLPLMFIGIPTLCGSWLALVYDLPQHAGLAENVLDHRLNCRTVYMNPINRFLYWNMNYHLEHHMFPMVPYHALPRLHELMKYDCPKPYRNLYEAFKEIIPTIIKQRKNPAYYVKRELPTPARRGLKATQHFIGSPDQLKDGWIEVCAVSSLPRGEVLRFDFGENTYAVYRTSDDKYYATSGICTHGNTHLSGGLVIGDQIECPKHNGRFDIKNGSAQRLPACIALRTYNVKTEKRRIYLAHKTEMLKTEKPIRFQVKSNRNVATFIKELVLTSLDDTAFKYKPGEYIQLEIPPFSIRLKDLDIDEPYRSVWEQEDVLKYFAENSLKIRRNFSMASNPGADRDLKFNVRLSLPPAGLLCSAGVGTTYVFSLKPGDIVNLYGPFGTFHARDSDNEMVYVGGGAGMAPLRSHISYLFETLKTKRKVSYWYGARSERELFYYDYFRGLESRFQNFSFHVALSEPLSSDNLTFGRGFVHELFKSESMQKCKHPEEREYYLCGPPGMIRAVLGVLKEFGVSDRQIAYDEF